MSAAHTYMFTDADTGKQTEAPGDALLEKGFFVRMEENPGSKLYFYKRKNRESSV